MNINTDNVKSKIKEVSDHWGSMMPMMTMEECGELIQAISKLERSGGSTWLNNPDSPSVKELRNNLIKEMADVEIAISALRNYYGIDPREVAIAIGIKLNKKYTPEYENDLDKVIEKIFEGAPEGTIKKQSMKRIHNALYRSNIKDVKTLATLVNKDDRWYNHVRDLGKASAKKLEKELEEIGLIRRDENE